MKYILNFIIVLLKLCSINCGDSQLLDLWLNKTITNSLSDTGQIYKNSDINIKKNSVNGQNTSDAILNLNYLRNTNKNFERKLKPELELIPNFTNNSNEIGDILNEPKSVIINKSKFYQFDGQLTLDKSLQMTNYQFINNFLVRDDNSIRKQSHDQQSGVGNDIPLLKFEVIPKGDRMKLADFHLTPDRSLFIYLSELLTYLEPSEYPFELLKQFLRKETGFSQLILKSIQVESGFLICISVAFALALVLPLCLLVYACCEIFDKNYYVKRLERQQHDDTIPSIPHEYEISWTENCRRRFYVLLMEIILVLLLFNITGMFITNSHFAGSLQKMPNFATAVFDDISTYVRNSHFQINFLFGNTIEQTMEAIHNDLNDIEQLLGRPIQHSLATETGVDAAQDTLLAINQASQEIATKISELLDECHKTFETIRNGQSRLRELKRHVDATLNQCTPPDRPLCGTLDSTNLEIVLSVDMLLTDPNLSHLEYLASGNFTNIIKKSRFEFEHIPQIIARDIEVVRTDVTRILTKHRNLVYESVQVLDNVVQNITVAADKGKNGTLTFISLVTNFQFWYWLTGFCTTMCLLIIWFFLLISLCCGCCGSEGKVYIGMNFVLFLLFFFTLGLWILTIAVFIVGGHLEIFICKPLYDEPKYRTLSVLLDKPGILYEKGGWLSNIASGNESLDIEIYKVLDRCHNNYALYTGFQLNHVYDFPSIINHQSWIDLYSEFNKIHLNVENISLLTPELQQYLQELLHASQINFSDYRKKFSSALTGKDLHSFATQLDSVATQVSDFMTASRLETLSSRTTKLIENFILPLQKHRETIVYLLTALEIKILPMQIQTNQSLAHLKTIQFYVESQGSVISQKKTREFVHRLIGYLDQFRKHVLDQLNNHLASCAPVWNIFSSLRIFICKHVMDPLNGFWFCSLLSLVYLMFMAPLAVKIGKCYRKVAKSLQHTDSHMSLCEVPTDIINNTWQTPETSSTGW